MQIDKLRNKEHPHISKILFQPSQTEGQALVEHMIVGSKSGVLIFESTLLVVSGKKDASSSEVESHMSVRYKISMLPEESVIDMVETSTNQILVCCQGGSYVILGRSGANVLQETWRFRGFTQPPKCMLATGDPNKVIIVERDDLCIID